VVVVTTEQEASVSEASTIGLDLAKHVFQAHGADTSGKVVFRKRLRREQVLTFFARQPACVVAMLTCRARVMTDDTPPRRPILTSEDVVKRIAAECAFIDERGGVGIRLRPAAALVRQYGEQFHTPPRRRRPRPPKSPSLF
jgi:hypothetical protein